MNARERDTIMAALRLWQATNHGKAVTSLPQDQRNMLLEISAEHGKPLTIPEVDALCESLNQ